MKLNALRASESISESLAESTQLLRQVNKEITSYPKVLYHKLQWLDALVRS